LKNAHRLHRFGNILIWIGVLVWVPFFALRIAGESPALMAFLPFHLAGVFSGARLRTLAHRQLGISKVKRSGYKRVAHFLVIASILVWIPYYAQRLLARPVELEPYLSIHLIGIFSGTGLMAIGSAWQYYQNKRISKTTYGHTTSKTYQNH
jgi:accessory gene regulator protein AgrB